MIGRTSTRWLLGAVIVFGLAMRIGEGPMFWPLIVMGLVAGIVGLIVGDQEAKRWERDSDGVSTVGKITEIGGDIVVAAIFVALAGLVFRALAGEAP